VFRRRRLRGYYREEVSKRPHSHELPSQLPASLRVPGSHLQLPPPRADLRCGHQDLRIVECHLQFPSRRPHPGSGYCFLLLPSSLHLRLFEEFFRDLFTGGFVESESNDFSQGSSISSGPIEVVFDDINITRAGT